MGFRFISTEKTVDVRCGTAVEPGRCTWADIKNPDSDFQCGQETLPPNPTGSRTITFNEPFTTVPVVLVWLTDINYQGYLSIHVSATKPNKTGFELQTDISARSTIHSAGIAWVAYPQAKKDILSGTFSTVSEQAWRHSQVDTHGMHCLDVMYDGEAVMVAINSLDIEESSDFTMLFGSSLFTPYDEDIHLCWSLAAEGEDASLYSVGITYLVTG